MNSTPIPAVVVIARVMLGLMFLLAGLSKFGNLQGAAGYITGGGLPMGYPLAVLTAAFEVLASIALIIGFQARYAALLLALFTLAASVLFHNFWAVAADKQYMQQLMFMKNLAVAGGLLFVFSFGAGPASVDARRASS